MREVEPVEPGADGELSADLLSFYERLRRRLSGFVDRKVGRIAPAVSDALLVVPDVFVLLARLVLDRDVPAESRRLIGGALLYFLLPADLFPEMLAGPAGFVDDLVLSAIVLSHAFGAELEERVERHWSGGGGVRETLSRTLGAGEALLGVRLSARVEKLARRWLVAGDA